MADGARDGRATGGFAGRLDRHGEFRLLGAAPARVGGRLVLFRGYLAGRDALRARLCPDQAAPTDAALLGHAAARWGAAVSDHVTGAFAAAVLDPGERTLLLVHDALGLVPLFYRAEDAGIGFAAFLEDLLPEGGSGRLDEEYVADHLLGRAAPDRRTPFAGTCRLLPGEAASWRGGVLRRSRHRVLGNLEPLPPDRPEAFAAELRRLVDEGVRAALPPDGPAWCELSGGLDSSTVLTFAARAAPARVAAVSMVYPRTPIADESAWIAAAAEPLRVPRHAMDADAAPPFSDFAREFVAEPNDRLLTGAALDGYDALFRAHGVGVVLTGQGGDAVFGGDGAGPFFLADLLRRGRLGALAGWAGRLAREGNEARPARYWLGRYAARPLLRFRRGLLVEDHFHRTPPPPWIAPGFAARLRLGARRGRQHLPPGPGVAATAALERVFAVVDGVTKHNNHPAAAVEFRHPLLHRPLVEFMLRVPPEAGFDPGMDRALQRRALAGVLPAPILARADKAGRGAIFFKGLERSPAWREVLTRAPRIVERGYVERASWATAVERAAAGHAPGLGSLLAAMSLEAWLRQREVEGMT